MANKDRARISRETELLYRGGTVQGLDMKPESLPVFLTTAFYRDDLEEAYLAPEKGVYGYGRSRNPNRDALAEVMTCLEGGEASLMTTAGISAITTSLLTLLNPGDHVVVNVTLYTESVKMFKEFLPRFGISHTFVDLGDAHETRAAIRPNTRMIYTEVISNPLIAVTDIDCVARLAKEHNLYLVVDNTFSTPLLIRPLEHGADVSINSVTKFVNGHHDALAGSITGKKAIIDEIYKTQMLLGSVLSPFECFLVLRGVQTMELRMEKAMKNAMALARALEGCGAVTRVHYPGLESHENHVLARELLHGGFGAMLSFEMPCGREGVDAFTKRLKLVRYAPTLGGTRTTLSYPLQGISPAITKEELSRMGIHEGLMRVSVGLEHEDDICEDFLQALCAF